MSEPETAAGRRLLALLGSVKFPSAPRWPEPERQSILAIEAELRASLAAKVDEIVAGEPYWPVLGAVRRRAIRRKLRAALIEGSDPASRSWPGRAEMEAMTDAEVNAFLESRGLDVRVIEGSDPASPEADSALIDDLALYVLATPAPTGTEQEKDRQRLIGLLDAREGSDPASPEAHRIVEAVSEPETGRAFVPERARLAIESEVRASLAGASLGEPRRIVNENFGWDFTVRSCRACKGDFQFLGPMPEGWDNRGHRDDCWFAALIEGSDPASPTCSDPEHPGGAWCANTTGLDRCHDPVREGSDPASPITDPYAGHDGSDEPVSGMGMIEGSDPASPPCKECGEAQAAPQHDPETILDPGTVGHEVHVFPVREGSDPASPEAHVRQSMNGCVTCDRRWNEHTPQERGEDSDPASPEPAVSHEAPTTEQANSGGGTGTELDTLERRAIELERSLRDMITRYTGDTGQTHAECTPDLCYVAEARAALEASRGSA